MSPSVTVRLLATQSDARLVELARQGHERAFEALVQRYRRPLLGYCRRALLPDARAEDALQQALLQAWIALGRGDEVRDVRAWLYRIVRNTALNALRSSGYDYAELHEALSGADAPQEDLDRRIAVREALAGLAALPEQQREALLRTAVEGESHADAAAEMGLSEGALRGLVYRARATLRTAATAITPLPLASWAAGALKHGGAAAAPQVAASGSSAGLAGLIAKGAAVAITAGTLAVGARTIVHHHGAGNHPASHGAALAVAPAGGAPATLGGQAVASAARKDEDRAGRGRRHDRRHGHETAGGSAGPHEAEPLDADGTRGEDRGAQDRGTAEPGENRGGHGRGRSGRGPQNGRGRSPNSGHGHGGDGRRGSGGSSGHRDGSSGSGGGGSSGSGSGSGGGSTSGTSGTSGSGSSGASDGGSGSSSGGSSGSGRDGGDRTNSGGSPLSTDRPDDVAGTGTGGTTG